MTDRQYSLRARVSSEHLEAVRTVLLRELPGASVEATEDPKECRVAAEVRGGSARDLNRALLTALRRVEKRTRLRAEWTFDGVTERFFDYVPKGPRTP